MSGYPFPARQEPEITPIPSNPFHRTEQPDLSLVRHPVPGADLEGGVGAKSGGLGDEVPQKLEHFKKYTA